MNANLALEGWFHIARGWTAIQGEGSGGSGDAKGTKVITTSTKHTKVGWGWTTFVQKKKKKGGRLRKTKPEREGTKGGTRVQKGKKPKILELLARRNRRKGEKNKGGKGVSERSGSEN